MNKLETLLKLADMVGGEETKSVGTKSFLQSGKVYAIRTVTMIYTGRLVAENEMQLLLEDAAWIPETERWMDFAATGAHREAEPYTRPVVLFKSGILDVTEIPNVITEQK
jgi:hypothetical protein